MSGAMWKGAAGALFLTTALGLAGAACSSNPYTGRSQFILIPERFEAELGLAAYTQALSQRGVVVSENPAELRPVQRVGERIVAAAMTSDYATRAANFDWDYTVIRNRRIVNAWAVAGGRIAFYTGMFRVARSEAGLAVVMGHEVAHVLARHGAERISRELVTTAGAYAVLSALDINAETVGIAAAGFGLTVSLPFSRRHESEADYIGLLLAAKAGYDPREAIAFWERFGARSGATPPEFLSTHPSSVTRIEDIKQWLPEALALYQEAERAPAGRRLPWR